MSGGRLRDVALIGALPPPWGGISVHLKRLVPLLAKAGISARVYNVTSPSASEVTEVVDVHARRLRWLMRFAFARSEHVVHLHGMDGVVARTLVLPVRWIADRRVIMSYHNQRLLEAWERIGPVWRRLAREQWRACSRIHVVSEGLEAFLISEGVSKEKVVQYPAFIPPEVDDASQMDATLIAFLSRPGGALLALASEELIGGRSIYGLDLLLPAFLRVREVAGPVGLVVIAHVGASGEGPLFSKFREQAEATGVGEDVLIVRAKGELHPVIRASRAYVRPSRTDGDAVAIREALHFGVPVVASDAVRRPEGVVTFRTEDLEGFAGAILVALARRGSAEPAALADWDGGARIVGMYRELLRE